MDLDSDSSHIYDCTRSCIICPIPCAKPLTGYNDSMDLLEPITNGSPLLRRYAQKLAKLGIITHWDLLNHLPTRYENYSLTSHISKIQIGETVTVRGTIKSMKNQYVSHGRVRTIQKATVFDETGAIDLLWFNQPYLIRVLPEGTQIFASGKVQKSGSMLSISSPVYETQQSVSLHTGRLVPVYPETKGVSSKWLRTKIFEILRDHPDITDFLPAETVKKNNLLPLSVALHNVHFPNTLVDAQNAHNRLAFDELFLMQLQGIEKRAQWNESHTRKPFEIQKYKSKIDAFIQSFPFKLTSSQVNTLQEIYSDLQQKKPMNRLLQGDVGSGKTIVSAVCMYISFLNGFSSILMAPTELLAKQHFQTLDRLLHPFGLMVTLLTGSTKKRNQLTNLIFSLGRMLC